jgi:protein involved in polysaccharide export with SLBB domain
MQPSVHRMNRYLKSWRSSQMLVSLGVATLCMLFTGCAAVTNPVAIGIPVRHLPQELLIKPKDEAHTIPLDLLGQPPPEVYRLAPNDVLGVWIDTVLGDVKSAVPVMNLTTTLPIREQRRLPPSFGYPVPVREDGTVHLPQVEPIKVQGLSISEAENAIRQVYVKNKILKAGTERVIVTMMFPRQVHVVVLRQESTNIALPQEGGLLAGGKRSTGHLLDLPAYENDVLHAVAQTGGLPGQDAYNEIVIFRNSFRHERDRAALLEKFRVLPPGTNPAQAIGSGAQVVRLPLRLRPGDPVPFGPQDVLVQTGDVVFIEARDHDLFYTGGLLPTGEHVLPRDYDLDVVKAITRVRGPLINGAFSTNNLAGNLISPGLGANSPSLVTVLRRTPDGGQVPIRVDLNRALNDPRENILVRAGDVLVLQEKPYDAVSRYLTQTFFNVNIVWQVVRSSTAIGVIDVAAPDRLGTRGVLLTGP